MKYTFLLSSVLLMSLPSVLAAQDQAAFDHNNEIYIIDRSLREQLGIFREHTGFLEATIYSIDEETYELNIITEREGRRQRYQELLSISEYEILRDRVTRESARLETEPDQSGRLRFLVGTTVLSAGYYGWAIPEALGIEDVGRSALHLLIGAGGYYVPSRIITHRNMTVADAKMSLYGGSRGILHGHAIGYLMGLDSFSDRNIFGLGSSLGGLVYGYRHSRNHEFTEGQSEFFRVAGNYGIWMGLGTAGIISDHTTSGSLAAAGYLTTVAAGHIGSHYMTMNTNATIGNARFMRTSYALGAVLPLGILSLTETENRTVSLASIMTSGSAGMIYANMISRDHAFTKQQGMTIGLATLASYLLGGGVGSLLSGADQGTTLISGAIGGLAGYTISLRRALGAQETTGDQSSNMHFDLGLVPAGNWFTATSAGETVVPVLRLRGTL